MKMYVITKELQRCTWAITIPVVHEVCKDLKTARNRVEALNKRAQHYKYGIEKADLYDPELA